MSYPVPRVKTLLSFAVVLLLAGAPPALAQPQANLGEASLEELMAVRVTTASRRSQPANDVAAAVFVITRDDIRRSGLTSLPEILRLAPGVQVARVNANKWAVSIRGFNDVFANKLLVLIDGRSIYARSFGGVLWDAQDLMVRDIERIEVIRGPGGALWGANAVNGVINVITRPAAETQGLAFDLSTGTLEPGHAGIRYGGALGEAKYRVFSQWSGYADMQDAAGASADDRWHSLLTGARVDWARGRDAVVAQGQYIGGQSRPRFLEYAPFSPGGLSADGVSQTDEVSALGRWTRSAATGSLFQVQASHTASHRTESLLELRERSTDIDVQYEVPEAARQAIVVGGGFRVLDLWTKDTFTLRLAPEHSSIFNAFVQDDITLARSVSLILGTKAEYDGMAGWGVLPSARILWRPTPTQRVWGAVSRARRTPAATDRTMRFLTVADIQGTRLLVGALGNPEYRNETLFEAEAGYRLRIGPALVEVALFEGTYDGLPTAEPIGPVFEPTPEPGYVFFAQQFANLMSVRTRGAEVNARWVPAAGWRLSGSYSLLDLTPRPDPASLDASASQFDGDAPRHQWQLHSASSVGPRLNFDVGVFYAGRLERLAVPAYTRVDTRIDVKLTATLSVIAAGQNLLDRRHAEFSGLRTAYVASSIPRSAHLALRWQF